MLKVGLMSKVCPPVCFDSLYMNTQQTGRLWRDHRLVKQSPQTENRPTDCIHHCQT